MNFLLVCDGKSDTLLVNHIQLLLIECGYTEPNGDAWYLAGRLTKKVRHALESSGGVDLLFVHRDAENPRNTEARYREIQTAITKVGYCGPCVAIVPVRMTEAWLLLDESAIRKIAGRPRDAMNLMLPHASDVEGMADPKANLDSILIQASGAQGRRLRRMRRELPRMRNQLLQDLQLGGPLEQVPSWVRFQNDTLRALRDLEIKAE